MRSKKRRVVKTAHRNNSVLSLDFLRHPKTPVRGAGIGLVLMVGGWLLVMSIVTIIGIIIFVPSVGAMVMKTLGMKSRA